MQLVRLRICNFQSFGSEPVVVELDRTTYLIGPNGVGKTSLLQALARMFGVDRSLRGVRRTDFHLDAGGRTASELWIEADFELPEAGDEEADSSTVPTFFNHMQLEQADSPATLRIRLTANLDVDEEVEERLEHVTQAAEDGEPLTTYGVSRLDRRQIEFHYLPARRDPAAHLTYSATSLLGRALRAVDWTEQRDEVIDLTSQIDDALKESDAIKNLGNQLQTQWNGVYKGNFFKTAEVAFNQRDLDTVFRYLTLRFEPALSDERGDLELLSDGQKSLLYISLVLAMHSLGGDVLAGKSTAFDVEKLRPAAFTIVAVEEPENSLAPHYLGRINKALRTLTSDDDAQAIVATHAPSMLRRIEPENIRYLRLDAGRRTVVRHIQLPEANADAAKFIREAVTAFPELYFARLVILGEGDSEEIALPRLLAASDIEDDYASIAVVPLGGRHVNHMWRLLHGLDIPHLTLLDLDVARFGGGWGRVVYAIKQLRAYSPEICVDVTDEALATLPKWNSDDKLLKTGSIGRGWIDWLEDHAVFFSAPLDLDLAMLQSFPRAYGIDDVGALAEPEEDVVAAVLGKNRHGQARYGRSLSFFTRYHELFKLGSKPAAHLSALSQLTDAELMASTPSSIARLLARAKDILNELPE